MPRSHSFCRWRFIYIDFGNTTCDIIYDICKRCFNYEVCWCEDTPMSSFRLLITCERIAGRCRASDGLHALKYFWDDGRCVIGPYFYFHASYAGLMLTLVGIWLWSRAKLASVLRYSRCSFQLYRRYHFWPAPLPPPRDGYSDMASKLLDISRHALRRSSRFSTREFLNIICLAIGLTCEFACFLYGFSLFSDVIKILVTTLHIMALSSPSTSAPGNAYDGDASALVMLFARATCRRYISADRCYISFIFIIFFFIFLMDCISMREIPIFLHGASTVPRHFSHMTRRARYSATFILMLRQG